LLKMARCAIVKHRASRLSKPEKGRQGIGFFGKSWKFKGNWSSSNVEVIEFK